MFAVNPVRPAAIDINAASTPLVGTGGSVPVGPTSTVSAGSTPSIVFTLSPPSSTVLETSRSGKCLRVYTLPAFGRVYIQWCIHVYTYTVYMCAQLLIGVKIMDAGSSVPTSCSPTDGTNPPSGTILSWCVYIHVVFMCLYILAQ